MQKQRKGSKLVDKFLGPYTINRHVGKGLYELRNKSGKVLQKKVNVNRLKRFNSNKVILLPQHHAMPFIMLYMCTCMYIPHLLFAFLQHYMNRMVEWKMMMRMMERRQREIERRQVQMEGSMMERRQARYVIIVMTVKL